MRKIGGFACLRMFAYLFALFANAYLNMYHTGWNVVIGFGVAIAIGVLFPFDIFDRSDN